MRKTPVPELTSLVIPEWANGPDGSANGGYAAGLLAAASVIDGAVEVNLRVPPPLGTAMALRPMGQVVELWSTDGEPQLVATAKATSLDAVELPAALEGLTPERAAEAAATGFPYASEHPFPRCLVCGVARDPDLPEHSLHCGEVDGTGVFADTWTPVAGFAEPKRADTATVAACWAALDCPSLMPFADPERPMVLAKFEVDLTKQARIGKPHVLAAWELERDGRKLRSASVLLDASGRVLGMARALWIEVRPA